MSRPVTKKDSIEAAAIKLFAHQGVPQVTIKEIAREADCAEGALYRHYRSKEEMAWELLKRSVEDIGKTMKDILFEKGTYGSRIKKTLEYFYEYYDQNPLRFSFALISQHDFPERKQHVIKEYLPMNLLTTFIQEGLEKKKFKINKADVGASMLLGMVLEPITQHSSGRIKGSLREHVPMVCDGVKRFLGI